MLYDILKNAAQQSPSQIAVSFENRNYTYSELYLLTNKLAKSLLELGIKKGDRTSFFLYNCPEILLCYFACFKIGATVVPINYRLKTDELHYIINHSKPVILISQRNLFHEVACVMQELTSLKHYYLIDWKAGEFVQTQPFVTLLNQNERVFSFPAIPPDTNAIVLYTSGTTGTPKGAVLTHSQLVTHTYHHTELVNYKSHDKTLVSLALANNFAFSHQMLAAIHAVATLEIIDCFNAQKVLSKIQQRGVTMLYMMPVMYHALVKLAETGQCPVPNKIRLAIVAGDTTPHVVFEYFNKYFGLELCEGMGMTETQIYALNPLGEGNKTGSVGKPVPYMEVTVLNDQAQSSPSGEVGEIAVKGDIVMRSYLDNPKASAESFSNGWFLTGDLGCFDDDGYLWFRGRRKQLIVHDGSNISPQEVEEVFYHHPSVSEAGVVGVPDEEEGEIVKVFIALKPDAAAVSEQELLDFARHHIADYKLPESIRFIESLPKGSTGKIDRKQLKKYALC
jgi:long-chain acyl-CoA synthetase